MNRYIPALQEYAPKKPFVLGALIDSNGVLRLDLEDEVGRTTRLVFDGYVAYRKMDEGDALVSLAAIASSGRLGLSFYIVEQSEFVDWFIAQSHGIRAEQMLTHYAVVTLDDIVDVISMSLPSFEVLASSESKTGK